MKKSFLFLKALFCVFAFLSFFSCQKNSSKDEFGIYHDFEETLFAAKKSGKKILLIFTKLDSAGFNETLAGVLHEDEYQKKIGEEFETCQIDFSKEKFEKEKIREGASFSEKKSAKKQKAQNERDMRVTTIYGAETPPTVMILSGQGYVISSITYLSCINTKEFSNIIEVEREKILAMEKMILAVKNASKKEKIFAIDSLYENTSTNYRYQLRSLVEEAISLDKKNESGLVGKYILAKAATDALDCYLDKKPQDAAGCYIKYVSSDFLSVEQKQQCYYAASYITGSETPSAEVSEKILGYLNAAISLDETTPLGKQCKALAERQQKILERQKQNQTQAEGAKE